MRRSWKRLPKSDSRYWYGWMQAKTRPLRTRSTLLAVFTVLTIVLASCSVYEPKPPWRSDIEAATEAYNAASGHLGERPHVEYREPDEGWLRDVPESAIIMAWPDFDPFEETDEQPEAEQYRRAGTDCQVHPGYIGLFVAWRAKGYDGNL